MTQDPTISARTGKPKQVRGFAAMDVATRTRISVKGGAAVPAHKRSFARDRQLAAEAGRKGGEAAHPGRRPAP